MEAGKEGGAGLVGGKIVVEEEERPLGASGASEESEEMRLQARGRHGRRRFRRHGRSKQVIRPVEGDETRGASYPR